MVEASFNYLAPMAERPVYYTYTPPPGVSWRNTRGDRQKLPVHDARIETPHLDREGFELVQLRTAAEDLSDESSIRGIYYPEVEGLVKGATGADRVVAFDHNLRAGGTHARGESLGMAPVRFVHNDYTVDSGPQRVRDLMGDEAEALLQSRFAVINVWKPISGPVEEAPLAVCSADSMELADFVPTSLEYPDRSGEVYSVIFQPRHRWYYYPRMQADEVLLLKCYDSDAARARFTAHSAFDDPASPPDPRPRESIEVRTLAFFAPA
ncbi:MAG: CmcJ/NvfI family oxidoreductase [Myxococcota bacterium]|nr:CmcJ/NvfI family oxidoreductase [Myxococcota bacterium]